MILPYLSEVQSTSKKYSVVFRGINYGEGTSDGELAQTHNLSADKYPCLTQRAERIKEEQYTNPIALHAKGKLFVIAEAKAGEADEQPDDIAAEAQETSAEGTEETEETTEVKTYNVYYDGEKVGTLTDTEGVRRRQIATVGNYIVIFPDKKYYKVPSNDEEDAEFGDMEETYTSKPYKLYTVDGGCKFEHNKIIIYQGSFIGDDNPFAVGDVVKIDNAGSNEKRHGVIIRAVEERTLTFDDDTFEELKMGATSHPTIERGYLEFTGSTIITTDTNFNFSEGDAVTISGAEATANNKEAIIRAVEENVITFDDNTFVADEAATQIVTIERTVPDLDFICESNYRLWGTSGNTIYASKYSSPLNFKVFDGLSSDSYYIDVGSEGEFTGCVPYSSHICFFKENTLHKLYGTRPNNFQITTANVCGLQSGSERSIQIVNEQLLYKGVNGVYAYTGGVPELISESFGNKRYSNAVACCDGEKYYISMKQGNKWDLFTYDILKNIWLREDDTQAVDMTFHNGCVYYIDSSGGLYLIDKNAAKNNVEWSATFCTINETMNERKGYSKFHLRTDLSAGSWFAVDIKTDNETKWQEIYKTHNTKAKTVSIPIIPTRCDSVDIRLRGKGECIIKTFIREFTVGSDV